MTTEANIVLKGNKKVIVAGIKFTNEDSHEFSLQELKIAANGMVNFYNKNSRNILRVYAECHLIDVPFIGSPSTVANQAGPYVKQMFPGRDIYVIISKFVDENHGDQTGKDFAYVKNTLIRDIQHECGHCFRLAHAGSYLYNGKGYTYDQYKDGLSPMGKFSATCLTGPAYDYLSWIPEKEKIVVSDVSQLPATFKLKRINNFTTSGLSMIIFKKEVLKEQEKDAYLSFPQPTQYFKDKPFVALHLRNPTKDGFGGGSVKIKTFANAFYDKLFTGLNMKINDSSNIDQIVITVSLTAPACPYAIEVVPTADSEQILSPLT